MDFDGIGLDFLEGKETVRLIEAYGFPADKILFAGTCQWKEYLEESLRENTADGERPAGKEHFCRTFHFLFSASCALHAEA